MNLGRLDLRLRTAQYPPELMGRKERRLAQRRRDCPTALLQDGNCKSDKIGQPAYQTAEDTAKCVWSVFHGSAGAHRVGEVEREARDRVTVYN